MTKSKFLSIIVPLLSQTTMHCMQTQLIEAVKAQDLASVNNLLERGAQEVVNVPGDDGELALHWAARLGAIDVVHALLDRGADPSLLDRDGDTPLHRAAFHNRVAIIRLLLEHGAQESINYMASNGLTPLGVARKNYCYEAAAVLLIRGAR